MQHADAGDPARTRRLRRAERREQITTAATRAFARTGFTATSLDDIAALVPDPRWAHWAGQLAPMLAIEAVIAWLDAGQPDPDRAADRIAHAIDGVIQAAQLSHYTPAPTLG